jgi:uncharacterized membrane protein
MPITLRAIRLLTIVIWVGGLIFFAFVVAPVAFSVLASTHEAGLVVRGTLTTLNTMGQICGLLFALSTLVLCSRAGTGGRKFLLAQALIVFLMMAATAVVQLKIIPAMERDRITAGGEIDAAPPNNPARTDFNRLHTISEEVEGAVLLLGVATLVLMAAETSGPQAPLTH